MQASERGITNGSGVPQSIVLCLVQTDFGPSKLFCRGINSIVGPNHFGQVQTKLFWANFYNLDLIINLICAGEYVVLIALIAKYIRHRTIFLK